MIQGLLLLGQNQEVAGRGIAGPRLRTAASTAGFDIAVTDIVSFLDEEQIISLIDIHREKGIKFIGLSTSWIDLEKTRGSFNWMSVEFFKKIKELYPDIMIVTGGHQSHRYQDIFDYIDYHFQGFSDLSFVEFLKHINDQPNDLKFKLYKNTKIIESNIDYPVADPDDIETVFTKEDNFLKHQPLPIELSRGCIFRCTFCRHPFQGKKDYDSYQRTPESIANELRRNYDLFGTTRYTIMDDTFNDSVEKLVRLHKAIDLAKLPNFEFVSYIKAELLVTKPGMIPLLASLGLRGAYIGFESFKNKTRKIIGKGTDIEKVKEAVFKLANVNNQQVLVYGSFIVGLPHESPEDTVETSDFLIKHSKEFCRGWEFHPLFIINKTVSVELSTEKSNFDQNPGKYNYVFKSDSARYNWQNEYFSYHTAIEHANYLRSLSKGKMRYGGWQVAGCWHLGMPDKDIQNNIVDVNFNGWLVDQLKTRTQDEYHNLLKTHKEK